MTGLFNSLHSFYQANTEISIAILVAIVFVFILKPKAAGKLLVVVAAFIVIGYIVVSMTDLADSAKDRKVDAAQRTDKDIEKSEE